MRAVRDEAVFYLADLAGGPALTVSRGTLITGDQDGLVHGIRLAG